LKAWQAQGLVEYGGLIANTQQTLTSIESYASPDAVAAYRQILTSLQTDVAAFQTLKFANGGAFTNGVVDTPTRFNMGLMGEAGPEAIMPLTRMADGSLGVAYSGQQSNAELVAEIRALRAEVAEMKQHTAAGVRVAQAVGKAQIQNLETIAEAATDTAHNQRLAELSR
jgi:hypothetical protein